MALSAPTFTSHSSSLSVMMSVFPPATISASVADGVTVPLSAAAGVAAMMSNVGVPTYELALVTAVAGTVTLIVSSAAMS